MIVPLQECGAKLDVGYHGRRLPKVSGNMRTKTIKRGSILALSSFQWHRTGRPNAVQSIGQGGKRRKLCFECSPDLRLHICIGPEVEYVNPHEALVIGAEKEK
jgi:hypothetical protein